METATTVLDRLSFASYPNLKSTFHCLVFFDGICIQHILRIEAGIAHWLGHTFDYTESSKFIGLTLEQIQDKQPHWKQDIWEAAILFFDFEPELETWRAGRIAFLKEFTCDTHITQVLITSLMEAK